MNAVVYLTSDCSGVSSRRNTAIAFEHIHAAAFSLDEIKTDDAAITEHVVMIDKSVGQTMHFPDIIVLNTGQAMVIPSEIIPDMRKAIAVDDLRVEGTPPVTKPNPFEKSEHAVLQLNGEKDPILIIKWKDILGTVERIMDVYQNISNTIEGIVVKGS